MSSGGTSPREFGGNGSGKRRRGMVARSRVNIGAVMAVFEPQARRPFLGASADAAIDDLLRVGLKKATDAKKELSDALLALKARTVLDGSVGSFPRSAAR